MRRRGSVITLWARPEGATVAQTGGGRSWFFLSKKDKASLNDKARRVKRHLLFLKRSPASTNLWICVVVVLSWFRVALISGLPPRAGQRAHASNHAAPSTQCLVSQITRADPVPQTEHLKAGPLLSFKRLPRNYKS